MDLHLENGRVARRIQTQRLLLRPMARGDLDAVCTLIGDYDVSAMLTQVPFPYKMSDAQEFFAMVDAGDVASFWMIEADGVVMGAVSTDETLGYWLGKPFWGHGFMTEAASAACDATFLGSDISTLPVSHFDENQGSAAVLAKLGFVKTGTMTQFSKSQGVEVASQMLELSRDRWQTLRDGRE